MVNRNYVKGILFVSLMMSAVFFAMAAAPTLTPRPSGDITSNLNELQVFNVTSDLDANFTWYFDTSQVYDNNSVPAGTPVNYSNSAAGIGIHNITVVANSSNGTASHKWLWNVTGATITENTAPNFTVNPAHGGITDTGASINFTV
ncbi:MAG TPA: hypothetical protein VIO11_03890, partial [Candidatus Methanoperedens sp.]